MLKICALITTILICLIIANYQDFASLLKRKKTHRDGIIEKGSDEINFLALGDWGGSPIIGALPAQIQTAAGMGRVAREISAEFVVTLGDNFYFSGVEDVDSKRFVETFESVYSDQSLLTIPWYMIGGNHDHYGNIDAQIQYTSSAYNTNKRWVFPSLYHSHSFSSKPDSSGENGNDSVTIDLIMIDTVDLCSKNEVMDEEDERYFEPLPFLPKSYAANHGEQWKWIEDQLSKSRADYLLVAGHYPVFSVCRHGPTETLIRHLRPLLAKYGAHYLSGHDHCMNHFVEPHQNPTDTFDTESYAQNDIHYILSGAGVECCYHASNLKNPLIPENVNLSWSMTEENNSGHLFWKKVKGGFSSFTATQESLQVRYHDHDGNVLFHAKSIQPRFKNKLSKLSTTT